MDAEIGQQDTYVQRPQHLIVRVVKKSSTFNRMIKNVLSDACMRHCIDFGIIKPYRCQNRQQCHTDAAFSKEKQGRTSNCTCCALSCYRIVLLLWSIDVIVVIVIIFLLRKKYPDLTITIMVSEWK